MGKRTGGIMIKTFADLVFINEPKGSCKYRIKAVMTFDNGYSVSVIKGEGFYGSTAHPYECATLLNGYLWGEIQPNCTAEEVTDIMKRIQLKP